MACLVYWGASIAFVILGVHRASPFVYSYECSSTAVFRYLVQVLCIVILLYCWSCTASVLYEEHVNTNIYYSSILEYDTWNSHTVQLIDGSLGLLLYSV